MAAQDSPWFDPARHADRRPFLLARNRIVAGIRQWFAERDFLEVDCAALAVSPGIEAHLHAFSTDLILPDGSTERRYLHTSPEFAAKKLLAAGEQRIFNLGHVWRNRERTLTHSPEFTMLEWYRVREDYQTIIADTLALVQLAAQLAGTRQFRWRGREADPFATAEWLTVNEAFKLHAGVDLLATLTPDGTADRDSLAAVSPVAFGKDESWSDIFSRILSEKVEPQLGLGRIIDTAALGLVDHRHLAIRSGIVGDAVMRLQRAGAIRTHVGRPAIRTTMILGSADLYEWAGEGNVLLSRVEDTHDAQSLGGVDDFFAINSALQVGLNGDVNSEVAGGRYTGAVGGLADFAEAATASTGGTSVIVLPSTAKGGRESRIVSPGPEVVSLPHRYVGAVITEFGAARLVGLDTRDRAIALAGIAHPVFRDQLMAAARNSTVA